MAKDLTTPDPSVVLDLLEAFRRSKAMFAAISLGVFDALAVSPKSLSDLAQQIQANPDALGRLLDACVGLQLLDKRDDQYENTPVATAYLSKTSPHRLTGYITHSNDVFWKLWGNLEDAVREGTHRWQQTFGLEGDIFAHFFKSEEAKRTFLMGMHGMGMLSSPRVVEMFDLSRFKHLVDLGGATGHLTIEAVRRYPTLRGTIFDLPPVVAVAREFIDRSPDKARLGAVAGDFFKDPLPEADLFALGRILHDWSAEKIKALLSKICARLPSGGGLLIAERLLNDEKTGPLKGQLQSLNMLVCTEGKERNAAEYRAILLEAGFAEVQSRATGSVVDAILATKR